MMLKNGYFQEAKEAKLDKVSRILPPVLVFLISSIFHEYVLMFVLQVCYPLLLLLFGGFGSKKAVALLNGPINLLEF